MAKMFMVHPGFPGRDPVSTTENAFQKVWSAKGWEVHTPQAPNAPAVAVSTKASSGTPAPDASTTSSAVAGDKPKNVAQDDLLGTGAGADKKGVTP